MESFEDGRLQTLVTLSLFYTNVAFINSFTCLLRSRVCKGMLESQSQTVKAPRNS